MNAPLRFPLTSQQTAADIARELGDIAVERVRLDPPIGMATMEDLERAKGCELIYGTLVEKAMGLKESILGMFIGRLIGIFVDERNLGVVAGEEGGLELLTGLVRKPDVAFISWNRFPGGRLPDAAYPKLAPDLAIEVISKGNTRAEMERKRREYFAAGVTRVWEVDRFKGEVRVYSSAMRSRTLTAGDMLKGEPVLPGFSVAVGDLFSYLERRA